MIQPNDPKNDAASNEHRKALLRKWATEARRAKEKLAAVSLSDLKARLAALSSRPEAVGPGGPAAISYGTEAPTRFARAAIKGLENVTGRRRILRLARGYEEDIAEGRSFWDVICDRYGVRPEFLGEGIEGIPREGPVVCVANHPFGVLDGLVFGRMLSERREHFKILANSVFVRAPEIEDSLLPISFDETRDAVRANIRSRKEALAYLAAGGCIGVFPGGAVSTASKFYKQPFDPRWKPFTAKLILSSQATVVPIYFDGRNSRAFQVASHVSLALRQALLLSEFESRIGEPLRVVVGKPPARSEIEAFKGDTRGLMDFLRRRTYELSNFSPTPLERIEIGKEW